MSDTPLTRWLDPEADLPAPGVPTPVDTTAVGREMLRRAAEARRRWAEGTALGDRWELPGSRALIGGRGVGIDPNALYTVPEHLVEGVWSGLTAPGDIYSGKVPLYDDAGRPSDEAVRRLTDTAGLGMTGGLVEPGGGLGVGMRIPKKPEFELWHGSPHNFNKFDSRKINTGEASQMEGWGHYLSDSQDVANWYAERMNGEPDPGEYMQSSTLSDFIQMHRPGQKSKLIKVSDETMSPTSLLARDIAEEGYNSVREGLEEGQRHWDDAINNGPDQNLDYWATRMDTWHNQQVPSFKRIKSEEAKLLQKLDEWEKAGVTFHKNPATVYQVGVHAPREHFLGLDTPLKEQSPHIRGALPEFPTELTGGDVQHQLLERWSDPRKVSQELKGRRIPGNEYQAGQSTPGFEDSDARNFVVFDPSLLSILDRYTLTAGGKQAGLGAVIEGGGRKGFRSVAQEAIDRAPFESAPAAQWSGYLRNYPGLKAEELEALRVSEKLAADAGTKISKADLAAHTGDSAVQLEEHWKGATTPRSAKTDDIGELNQWLQDYGGMAPDYLGSLTTAETRRLAEQEGYSRFQEETDPNPKATKFHQYQLPGGTNYRELVLTLPERKTTTGLPEGYTLREEGPGRFSFSSHGYSSQIFPTREAAIAEAQVKARELGNAGTYHSSHWDEPNPLLHVRMNDRTLPDAAGNPQRTLFLEEVQSDWHQAGRKQGYKVQPVSVKDWSAKVDPDSKEWLIFNDEGRHVGEVPSGFAVNEEEALRRWAGESGKGVPDAPFKKTWPDLALKRMVQEAVDHGYDQVAWTDGATQAERYDLSKHIDSVIALPNKDGTWDLHANRSGFSVLTKPGLKPEELADHIGKEAADKIVNTPTEKRSDGAHVLSGLDLKVGGEGMRGFYDSILPRTANRLFGKWGAKVRQEQIPKAFDRGTGNMSEAKTIHVLPITPELRAAVHDPGLTLFAGGGKPGAAVGATTATQSPDESSGKTQQVLDRWNDSD